MFYKAMLKKKKNKKAFTLIELIVVIAIIGVLVAILVPTMSSFVGNATNTTAKANARTIYGIAQAQCQFAISNGSGAPTAVGTLKSTPAPAANSFMDLVAKMVTVPTGGASGAYYEVNVTSSNGNYYVSSVVYHPDSTASGAAYPS